MKKCHTFSSSLNIQIAFVLSDKFEIWVVLTAVAYMRYNQQVIECTLSFYWRFEMFFSRAELDKHGKVFLEENPSKADRDAALDMLSEWRKLHYIPMNTLQANLRNKCKRLNLKNYIIAQRIKRLPSIVTKLSRFPDMKLSRMQDIGGLRIILPSIKNVYDLHNAFKRQRKNKHTLILPPKDYINEPKKDGYRSLHQVFKYQNTEKPELDGLRIELQIRTKLQHAWATAVETLGVIEKSSFKTGGGDEKYRRFFVLCSALFAIQEKMPLPQNVANDEAVIKKEFNQLLDELKIIDKLKGITAFSKHVSHSADWYVLIFNYEKRVIKPVGFSNEAFDEAQELYTSQERKNTPNSDVVLFSSDSFKELKKAYPNYFLDTTYFVREIQQYVHS